jgi:hypothetical protein
VFHAERHRPWHHRELSRREGLDSRRPGWRSPLHLCLEKSGLRNLVEQLNSDSAENASVMTATQTATPIMPTLGEVFGHEIHQARGA